jgi:predicted outer membrane repeat protein
MACLNNIQTDGETVLIAQIFSSIFTGNTAKNGAGGAIYIRQLKYLSVI